MRASRPIRFERPSGLLPTEIDEIAGQLASELAPSPDLSITSVVARLGGSILLSKTLPDESAIGSLSISRAENSFVISVPATFDAALHRYLVSKELGHYFLHHLLSSRRMNEPFTLSANDEAEIFALCFLMPKADFERRYYEKNTSPEILASYYHVPRFAVEKRAQLIPERQVETA